jgi:hypothetical protein
MLDQILHDLQRPDPPPLIVIDPKGLRVERLARLAVFDPDHGRLRDRLIIFDPKDIREGYAPALNMFQVQSLPYPTPVLEQLSTTVIDLFSYLFKASDYELTATQKPVFDFLAPLMMSVPDASLNSMISILGAADDADWRQYIDRQEESVREFFQDSFFHPREMTETKKQVRRRLRSLLARRPRRYILNAPRLGFDPIDILQNRKILLINTGMTQLDIPTSQLFGKIFIALLYGAVLARNHFPQSAWHPAFMYVDEFPQYADEIKMPEVLQLSREFHFGCILAIQTKAGLTEKIMDLICGNCSIKLVGAIGGRDVPFFKRDLDAADERVIQQQQHLYVENVKTSFACLATGVTLGGPASLEIKFDEFEKQPCMSEQVYQKLRRLNRERYCVPISTGSVPNEAPSPDIAPEPSAPSYTGDAGDPSETL